MKKVILILALLLTYKIVSSQPSNLGVYFSLNNNYRILSSDFSYLDSYDKKVNLFNCGISYEKKLFTRFSLITGIDYSIDGYIRTQFVLPYSINQRLNYLGIPLELNYKIIDLRKIMIRLHFGVNFKTLIVAKYIPENIKLPPYSSGLGGYYVPKPETQTFTWNSLSKQGYSIFNMNLLGGIGFCYKFKNLSFDVSPEYKYSLLPTTKDNTYFHTHNERLYSYGIRLTLIKN